MLYTATVVVTFGRV